MCRPGRPFPRRASGHRNRQRTVQNAPRETSETARIVRYNLTLTAHLAEELPCYPYQTLCIREGTALGCHLGPSATLGAIRRVTSLDAAAYRSATRERDRQTSHRILRRQEIRGGGAEVLL